MALQSWVILNYKEMNHQWYSRKEQNKRNTEITFQEKSHGDMSISQSVSQ